MLPVKRYPHNNIIDAVSVCTSESQPRVNSGGNVYTQKTENTYVAIGVQVRRVEVKGMEFIHTAVFKSQALPKNHKIKLCLQENCFLSTTHSLSSTYPTDVPSSHFSHGFSK